MDKIEKLKEYAEKNTEGFTIQAKPFLEKGEIIPQNTGIVIATSNNVDVEFSEFLLKKLKEDNIHVENGIHTIGGWKGNKGYYVDKGICVVYSNENKINAYNKILEVWNQLDENENTKQQAVYDISEKKTLNKKDLISEIEKIKKVK